MLQTILTALMVLLGTLSVDLIDAEPHLKCTFLSQLIASLASGVAGANLAPAMKDSRRGRRLFFAVNNTGENLVRMNGS